MNSSSFLSLQVSVVLKKSAKGLGIKNFYGIIIVSNILVRDRRSQEEQEMQNHYMSDDEYFQSMIEAIVKLSQVGDKPRSKDEVYKGLRAALSGGESEMAVRLRKDKEFNDCCDLIREVDQWYNKFMTARGVEDRPITEDGVKVVAKIILDMMEDFANNGGKADIDGLWF